MCSVRGERQVECCVGMEEWCAVQCRIVSDMLLCVVCVGLSMAGRGRGGRDVNVVCPLDTVGFCLELHVFSLMRVDLCE